MIKVRIIGADGKYVSRNEIISLYASDMNYVPYLRKSTVDSAATIHLEVPESPVILHAKLNVPGFGYGLWIISDNCGAGYGKNAEVDFIHDAAASRVCEVEALLAGKEFKPSVKLSSMLRDAKTLLAMSSGSSKAHAYNMMSLAAGMWAGELAVFERAQKRIVHLGKREGFKFGCNGFSYPFDGKGQPELWNSDVVDPRHPGVPSMKENYESLFNFALLPAYMRFLEPEYGKPDFSQIDRLQAEFEKAGIETKVHPLWWAHDLGMPDWTHSLKWEDGSIKREIDRTIHRTVQRYKGRIHYYDAINESHDWCNAYNLTQDQQAEMTKYCCDAIHDVDPDITVIVNGCFLFGENAADGRTQWGPTWERNLVPYTYFEKLTQIGTEFDAIGMQMYNPARDMMAMEKLFCRFDQFNIPLHITELGVPSFPASLRPDATSGDIYCLDYMYRGAWHEMEWSERTQADWVEQFYTIAYAHPTIEAISTWSFTDPGFVPGAGYYTDDFEPKESYYRLKELEKSWGFNFGKK